MRQALTAAALFCGTANSWSQEQFFMVAVVIGRPATTPLNREFAMKKLLMAAAVIGSFATITAIAVAPMAPAMAREAFSFSFDTGAVRFAYSDGYYDHDRRWHSWRNAREAREFRARFSDRYDNRRRDRLPNRGWRDQDRDGVPNRYDRDRDGDGRVNSRDDAPNNPYRR